MQEFLDSSRVRKPEASKRDQLVVIDGSRTVTAVWARMDAFLDDLEQVLLADDLVVTGVNGT
jgi:hypothetical protein